MCMKKGVACVERGWVSLSSTYQADDCSAGQALDKHYQGLRCRNSGFGVGRGPIPEGCRSYKGIRGPATDVSS